VDVDVSLDYGLTLLAALLIGTGFVLQQNAAQREPASRFLSLRLITDLLKQPRWLAGIACMICGQVLAAWSIGNLSLAFVEPLLTTNLVFALLLAVPIAKATLRFWEIFGAVVLCLGVALLSAARSAKPIGLSFGSVSHWPAAAVIAAIAFAAVHAGRRYPGRPRAMLTGMAAGLVFGIQDALTRQTLQILNSNGAGAMFTTWAPYALVGAGAIGIWLMQSAFNSGPLPLSLPAISAGEPLVGIFLGVLVFGDRIQIAPGELALQAGGIFALIVGVILVGRAPALSQLRRLTPPSLPHIAGNLPTLPSLPSLPSFSSLPGLPGRHSTDDGQADKDQAPRPGGDAYASGSGHSNGDGQTNGHANVDGRPPPDLARPQDSTPADEPADHPNPLRRPTPPVSAGRAPSRSGTPRRGCRSARTGRAPSRSRSRR
jgi:drug/metabolite transporter (DMT)-like permease